ncbi:4Fe-4S dicluster domain-containing protein [Anaerotalea alkaliphila]|uniref:ATPase n=1 Tax=Anaerotalea alkaliphila TaxID=2662126 RepID=A0A7X5KNA7_9FIRM|nr:ATP-binding protein [Anaerotalea alkaliphila]NDL68806.1 ATPase [Anaerotalea alkaliphila]
MRIAVLSGKGGTGKTLVSVNLAAVAGKAAYVDCDVEEPNGHLFLKPEQVETREVTVKIPVVEDSLCTACRICTEFCRFNALALVREKLLIFEEICHSCGGCTLLCPQKALWEKDKVIGKVEAGSSGEVRVLSGIMNTGEESGVPVIKALLRALPELDREGDVFIDCPPGSACTVMESIQDADFCVLVAEPTRFGAQNLSMVHELVEVFHKPHGVVLNKVLEGEEDPSEEYCKSKGVKILGRIPFDRHLGNLNAGGRVVSREEEAYRTLFEGLLQGIRKEVRHEAAAGA